MDKILANEEIRSLFAMGTGFGAEFVLQKRVIKSVIMTDRRVDGKTYPGISIDLDLSL